MIEKISAKRSTLIAVVGAAIPAIAIGAVGNQGLSTWRGKQAASANEWLLPLVKAIDGTGWRFSPHSGTNQTQIWAAPLVANVLAVVLTGLLLLAVARSVHPSGGSGGLFFGAWGVTTLALGAAPIAAVPLISAGTNASSHASVYYTVLQQGLFLGFLIGFVVALATLIGYGATSGTSETATKEVLESPSGFEYSEPAA